MACWYCLKILVSQLCGVTCDGWYNRKDFIIRQLSTKASKTGKTLSMTRSSKRQVHSQLFLQGRPSHNVQCWKRCPYSCTQANSSCWFSTLRRSPAWNVRQPSGELTTLDTPGKASNKRILSLQCKQLKMLPNTTSGRPSIDGLAFGVKSLLL